MNMHIDKETEKLIKIIWDYHHMHQPLQKADAILCLGCYDLRVPEYAADLFLKGYAPIIIFSGGQVGITKEIFNKSEAELFSEIALKKGVPADKILIENQSTNTGENIEFTKKMLDKRGLNFETFIVVHKPYMERRSYATFKKQWPEKKCIVTSMPLTFEEYSKGDSHPERVMHAMVSDMRKIKEYPEKGFQIPQEIPDEVWQAYEKLSAMGYGEQALKN